MGGQTTRLYADQKLSELNPETTGGLISRALGGIPAWQNDFVPAVEHRYFPDWIVGRYLTPGQEDYFSLGRVRYQFRWEKSPNLPADRKISWLEVRTPYVIDGEQDASPQSFEATPQGSPLSTPTSEIAPPPNGGNADWSILPIQLHSLDRMLRASFRVPEWWTGVTLRNRTTGEDLGEFEHFGYELDAPVWKWGSSASFKIYDSEDEVFSEEEMTGAVDAAQKVVFLRDKDDPGIVHLYAIFREVGEVELTISGAAGAGTVTHQLTADAEFAGFIAFLDDRIDALPTVSGPDHTFPQPEGAPAPPAGAMAAARVIAASPTGELRHRNFVTKCLIPWLDGRIKVGVSTGKGFVDGFWDGARSDLEDIQNIISLITTPKQRAAEIYHTFQALKNVKLSQIGPMVVNMLSEFLNSVEQRIPWGYNGDNVVDREALIGYLGGYLGGYAGEQVLVAVGTVGLAKIGVVAKAGRFFGGLIERALRGPVKFAVTAANATKHTAQKFKSGFVRFASQYLPEPGHMPDLRRLGQKAVDTVENGGVDINGRTPGVIIQNLTDSLTTANINLDVIAREIASAQSIQKNLSSQGKGFWFIQRLAQTVDLLGPGMTEKSIVGFIRTYDRLINSAAGADRFDDLLALMKADTAAGKTALKDSLEAFKDATEGAAQGAKVRFMIKGIENVHPTTFRYASEFNGQDLVAYLRQNNGALPLRDWDPGWYMSFDKFDSGGNAKDAFQLPAQTPPQYRMHVSTNQIASDIRMPYGKDEQLGFFEAVCRDHTSRGAGGGNQVLINQPHTAIEVWDISSPNPQKVYP